MTRLGYSRRAVLIRFIPKSEHLTLSIADPQVDSWFVRAEPSWKGNNLLLLFIIYRLSVPR